MRPRRACFIGAGGHAFRNVYPAFRYAPGRAGGVCDLDEVERAKAFAARSAPSGPIPTTSAMLAEEKPDAVFIVTTYTRRTAVSRRPTSRWMRSTAGAHVWMEKPTAASRRRGRAAACACERKAGRIVMTGLKKIFFPTIEKTEGDHRPPGVRPADLGRCALSAGPCPRSANRGDLVAMQGFLDHIYHPAAILNYLMGPIERASYEWEADDRRHDRQHPLQVRRGRRAASGRRPSRAPARWSASRSSARAPMSWSRTGSSSPTTAGARCRPTAAPQLASSRTNRRRCSGSRSFRWASSTTTTCSRSATPRRCRISAMPCSESPAPTGGRWTRSLEIMKLFEAYRTNDAGTLVTSEATP